MAAQPEIQNAYAMHWLAARDASAVPSFQHMTQNLIWGLYGATALSGLLRHALSGRTTAPIVASIIDQINLINYAYDAAVADLKTFLNTPEAQDFTSVAQMVRAFQPLDRLRKAVQEPMRVVTTELNWVPGPTNALVPIEQARLDGTETRPPAEGG